MRSVANMPFLGQINLSLQNRVSAIFISFASDISRAVFSMAMAPTSYFRLHYREDKILPRAIKSAQPKLKQVIDIWKVVC